MHSVELGMDRLIDIDNHSSLIVGGFIVGRLDNEMEIEMDSVKVWLRRFFSLHLTIEDFG